MGSRPARFAALLLIACSTTTPIDATQESGGARAPDRAAEGTPSRVTCPPGTFLKPNTKDQDGTPAFIHFAREDMPLRVSVGKLRKSARYASRAETEGRRLRRTGVSHE